MLELLILILIFFFILNKVGNSPDWYLPHQPQKKNRFSSGDRSSINDFNRQLANRLKKVAKPSGKLHAVEIYNVYNTLDTLAWFFYQKKHEWGAICLLDEHFICRFIWFIKGENRFSVNQGITAEEIIDIALQNSCKYIITAHNHPVSSLDRPDYGSRRANIYASYAHKEAVLEFSDIDYNTAEHWLEQCHTRQIGFADALLVARDVKLRGDNELVENYRMNKVS